MSEQLEKIQYAVWVILIIGAYVTLNSVVWAAYFYGVAKRAMELGYQQTTIRGSCYMAWRKCNNHETGSQ